MSKELNTEKPSTQGLKIDISKSSGGSKKIKPGTLGTGLHVPALEHPQQLKLTDNRLNIHAPFHRCQLESQTSLASIQSQVYQGKNS